MCFTKFFATGLGKVMTEPSPDTQKKLAIRIAASASDAEKEVLRQWIERLLELKTLPLQPLDKAKQAISLTAKSDVVVSTVKLVARETKRLGWDERGVKGRLGIVGAGAGLALFGSQGAGIAALGTAIGVPLWVVFGAGGAFLGVLYEEITKKAADRKD
jgi:hypothetical protein